MLHLGFWYPYRNIFSLVDELGISPFTGWTKAAYYSPQGLAVISLSLALFSEFCPIEHAKIVMYMDFPKFRGHLYFFLQQKHLLFLFIYYFLDGSLSIFSSFLARL
jgi:hypothetical protein